MVSCRNVAVCWARCIISELSACSVAVVGTFAIAAKHSVYTFISLGSVTL